jgi:antagonist of KipI
MNFVVTRAGFSTTVQDLGRFGSRQIGVSVGGALDSHAFRITNLLVGNEENAAGLEIASGHVQLEFNDSRLVAWSGGDYVVVANGRNVRSGHAMVVQENEILSISGPRRGCRAWLAISGGMDVPTVLASRATDVRAHFGGFEGRILRDGDILPLRENAPHAKEWIAKLQGSGAASFSAPLPWVSPTRSGPVLRIVRGADWHRFSDGAVTRGTFTASAASDRMGVRLEGHKLKRNDHGDLRSEAVIPGTIQVPPGGDPILLLGDCQTIGGYPKIAHVITVDLPVAAQLGAGERVRFAEVSMENAHRMLLERETETRRFRIGLSLHA